MIADLPGTQGKTIADQRSIDRTVARGCAGGIVEGLDCDRHTEASAKRRAELEGE